MTFGSTNVHHNCKSRKHNRINFCYYNLFFGFVILILPTNIAPEVSSLVSSALIVVLVTPGTTDPHSSKILKVVVVLSN